MPDEIFWIVIISILAGTFASVVKSIINYLNSRPGGSGEKGSLTESQLRTLIEASVDRSISPLAGRLESIERRMERALDPPSEQARLASHDEDAGVP